MFVVSNAYKAERALQSALVVQQVANSLEHLFQESLGALFLRGRKEMFWSAFLD